MFGVEWQTPCSLTLAHPGFPGGSLDVVRSELEELESLGLVTSESAAPAFAQHATYYSLTTKGRDHLRRLSVGEVITGPRLFIVHGHDDVTKWEVKNFLQNRLHLPEPVVLHELANRGRTIIEKFEEHAEGVDDAVVLLTPDDQ